MISDRQMRFDDLTLFFNDSYVGDHVHMNYQKINDLTKWITKVDMVGNLKNSKVKGEDLGRFVSAMYDYKGYYQLNGQLNGSVDNLALKNFEIGFGQKSKLKGDFSFKGLPNVTKTQMEFSMNKSIFFPNDLAVFITQGASEKMNILGSVAFDGKFKGTYHYFHTSGQ
jgi:hypothetical protein